MLELDLHGGWVFGVVASLLACTGTTFGFILQKYSHSLYVVNDPALARKKKLYWWFSLFLMICVPAPLDILALGLASQSLLAPLSAVTLILTLVFAPMFLPEKVLRVDVIAVSFITVGSVVSTVFGTHVQEVYDVPALYKVFSAPEFLVTEAVVIVMITSMLTLLHLTPDYHSPKLIEARRTHGHDAVKLPEKEHAHQLSPKVAPFVHAVCAALVAAHQMVIVKIGSELLILSFNGKNQLAYATTWIIVAVGVSMAIFQVRFLSSGLERYDAIFYLSIYNALLICFSIGCGGFYFSEFKHAKTLSGYFVGSFVTVCGVLILLNRPSNTQINQQDYMPLAIDDDEFHIDRSHPNLIYDNDYEQQHMVSPPS